MRRHVLGWTAGAACVAAVAVAVLATRRAPHAGGSPIDPRGGWHAAWIVSCLAALALSGVAVLLARSGALRLRTAIAVAVVVQALPLAAPLLLSQDAFLYWAEARVITVHHANPYRVTPSRYPGDPGTQAASRQWRTEKEPYGPAWAAVGTVPALTAGHSADRAQLGYRALAFVCMLGILGLLVLRTRSPASVALLGWNPLIALHYAGGGHSDAVLILALVGALVLGATAAGGAVWPVAAMFKPFPLVFLPLEVARRRLRMPKAFWVGLAASAVILVVAAAAAFGTAWVSASVVGVHGTSPIGGVHFLTESGLRHRYAVAIGGLLFVAVYAVLLRTAWERGRPHLGFAAAALCMCSSLLRPWYALWPLALGALEEDGLSMSAAYALAAYVLVADALPTW